jgi:hypothetical protein
VVATRRHRRPDTREPSPYVVAPDAAAADPETSTATTETVAAGAEHDENAQDAPHRPPE